MHSTGGTALQAVHMLVGGCGDAASSDDSFLTTRPCTRYSVLADVSSRGRRAFLPPLQLLTTSRCCPLCPLCGYVVLHVAARSTVRSSFLVVVRGWCLHVCLIAWQCSFFSVARHHQARAEPPPSFPLSSLLPSPCLPFSIFHHLHSRAVFIGFFIVTPVLLRFNRRFQLIAFLCAAELLRYWVVLCAVHAACLVLIHWPPAWRRSLFHTTQRSHPPALPPNAHQLLASPVFVNLKPGNTRSRLQTNKSHSFFTPSPLSPLFYFSSRFIYFDLCAFFLFRRAITYEALGPPSALEPPQAAHLDDKPSTAAPHLFWPSFQGALCH